jgi:hypothetical protein
MTGYELALFTHLLGVVTLFAAIALVETAGARLRRAANVQHVRLWVDLTRTAAPLFPVALLTVLGSGLFMAADSWTFTTPWVVVAIAGVIVMGGIGGIVQGRYFAAIGRTARATEDGPVPQPLGEFIAAPALWVSIAAQTSAPSASCGPWPSSPAGPAQSLPSPAWRYSARSLPTP